MRGVGAPIFVFFTRIGGGSGGYNWGMVREIILANPRGFCAGVERAIEIVERALARFGPPIYVKHEVVHNRRVVDGLAARGAIFIEDVHSVPEGATLIFSAHGVSQKVRREAASRGLNVFDATCPLVTKVHAEVRRMRAAGLAVVMIGHRGHPEVEGTLGQADGGVYLVENIADANSLQVADENSLAFVTQTTLSVDDTAEIADALRARFPNIKKPAKDDICYATQNRQDAVKSLAEKCDVVLVVGSPSSSNSNRLREVARALGKAAYLIDDASAIRREWLEGINAVGVTAGASAPEPLVGEVVARIRQFAPAAEVCEMDGRRENVVFSVPKELIRLREISSAPISS